MLLSSISLYTYDMAFNQPSLTAEGNITKSYTSYYMTGARYEF
jgi:hypothetical protein